MATITAKTTDHQAAADGTIPPLENGDKLTRPEFERRYDAMPHVKKAELVEGIVYMGSPVGFKRHGNPHFELITCLGVYSASTPGVLGGDNGSIRLDLDNMPQPDAFLVILPSHGGRVRISADDYVEGGPELIAEIASSSVSIDLNAKFQVYRRNGVLEYVVWRVRDRAIDWYVLRGGQYEKLQVGPDGSYQSVYFPGLWLDAASLAGGHLSAALGMVQRGLASPEHAAFVARLQEESARRGV